MFMFGYIIDKNTVITKDDIEAVSERAKKKCVLLALHRENLVRLYRLSRSLSLSGYLISTLQERKRLMSRLDFSFSESAEGAYLSLFCYTPCYLNVKSEKNRTEFARIFSRFGKRAILPYLPAKIKEIKPEFSKFELEKILSDDIFDIIPLLRAQKAYPYRSPYQAQAR